MTPTPPPIDHNAQAEQAVLGSLLLDNSGLGNIGSLQEQDFYFPQHQRLFGAIKRLVDNGTLASPITLKAQFEGDALFAEIGGANYLAELCRLSVAIIAVGNYAEIVRGLSVRRNMRRLLSDALERCSGDDSPDQLVAGCLSDMQTLLDNGTRATETDHQVLASIIDGFKDTPKVVKTGFTQLDAAMGGGLYQNKVYGIAARKKYGKTAISGNIAWNVAQSGEKVLFICGEMGAREIMERLIAWQIGEPPISFRTARRNHPDFQRKCADALSRLQGNLLFHYDPMMTLDSVKSVLMLNLIKHRISGFFLDYWQLVGGKEQRQSEREHLDGVAQWLAGFAKKHSLWGVVMAQINQDGNTRGGEGMRLAFDQVYRLERRKVTDSELLAPDAWLEMMETRYTPWIDVGSETRPAFELSQHGTHFVEMPA